MAINFPSSPTDGQQYTYNKRSWTWNAAFGAWLLLPVTTDDANAAAGFAAAAGNASRLRIGVVESGATAGAEIIGAPGSQLLNLILPIGEKGDKGDKGDNGDKES